MIITYGMQLSPAGQRDAMYSKALLTGLEALTGIARRVYTCFGYRTKGKCPPRFHLAFDGRGDRETAYRCVCFRVCCVPRARDASVLAKQIKRRVRIQWATHKPGKPGELIPHIGATPPVASSSRAWLARLPHDSHELSASTTTTAVN